MKNIKFRAYNPRDKKIHYDITGFEFFGDGNMSGVFIDGVFFLIEEVELMQYTGLKDKNGKEIYEGDIIKAYDSRIQGEVIFDLRGLHFGVRISEVENYTFSQNFLNSKDIEVIGNIYDNPGLLEKGAEE